MSIEIACSELESIIDSQWDNGMLPHIRFVDGETGYSPDNDEWECNQKTKKNIFKTSGITQPPVMGMPFEKIGLLLSKDIYNLHLYLKRIQYISNGIEEFHDFLFTYRDPYGENIITIIHPWESGLDNSPVFDLDNNYALKELDEFGIQQQIKDRQDIKKVVREFRPGEKDYNVYGKLIGFYKKYSYSQSILSKISPFRVQDILYNVLLCLSLESLIRSYKILSTIIVDNSYNALIQKNENKLKLLKSSIKSKLYNKSEDNFYSYSLNLNKHIKENTIQTLIANLYFCNDNQEMVNVINAYQNSEYLNFLSTSNLSDKFNQIKYWRGPVWPVTNWIVIEIIKRKDKKLALKFSKELLELISEGYNVDNTKKNAEKLMYFNLVFNRFTTPSKNQYKHGWLWDSAFSSLGWLNVEVDEPSENIFHSIYLEKNKLLNEKNSLLDIRMHLKSKYNVSLFDEYYVPIDTECFDKGEPIGSEMMTWTAAIYLDIYCCIKDCIKD